MAAVQHLPGKFENLMQHCARCGALLFDYRSCAWPVNQPPPSGVREGVELVIEKVGRMTSYVPANEFQGIVTPCSPIAVH